MKTYLDSLPLRDIVRSTVESFAYSFTVSLVLSKGSLRSGLTGGALGACAVVIRVVYLALIHKGNEYFGSEWSASLDRGLAFMTVLVVIDSTADIKSKTSLFFSVLPFLLIQKNREEVKFPLMCIVV